MGPGRNRQKVYLLILSQNGPKTPRKGANSSPPISSKTVHFFLTRITGKADISYDPCFHDPYMGMVRTDSASPYDITRLEGENMRAAAKIGRYPAPVIAMTLLVSVAMGSAVSAQVGKANPLRGQTAARPAPSSQVRLAAHTTGVQPSSAHAGQAAIFAEEPVVDVDVVGQACPPARGRGIWGSVEYLMWWENGRQMPALVTTSDAGTVRDDAGVLGLSSTSVLFGGSREVETDIRSGGRLTFGRWIDPGDETAIGGRLFGIGQKSATFATDSDRTPILARPFFNAFTNTEDALLLGFPNEIRGDVRVELETEAQGAQAFVRQLFRADCNYRVDLIYGYRFLNVKEALRIDNSLEFIDSNDPLVGTVIDQSDVFDFDNEFHGGELGLMGHSVDGRWTLDFMATVALGQVNQMANIRGLTTTTPGGGTAATANGGLLTQDSNIGRFRKNDFAVVPEVTVAVGYVLSPRLDVSVGYSFLYIDQLARVHRSMDRSVNLTQQTGALDGPERPVFAFKDADYWLQGLNFGLNWRF